MKREAELVERELVADLARRLEERVRDEAFMADLYRGLAGRAWRKDGVEGEAAPSRRRAEELVNELRALASLPRLELAQTGGEGEVSKTLAGELGRLGWTSRPLHTGGHDAAHLDDEESPPPASRGPAGEPAWASEAHAEAEEWRRAHPAQAATRRPG